MNSEAIYACTMCYTTYDKREDAVECAINKCNVVETKYQCSECETLWESKEGGDFCCSDEDTLEYREQFDDAITGIDPL